MKVSPFPASSIPVLLLFLLSCGGGGEKKAAESTDTATAVTEPAPVNTIVTTPENMALVRHKVKNFATWLALYDAHDSMRLANGIHSYVIGRGVEDTNMVFVATKFDDLEKAIAFSKSASLKTAMQKGGVIGAPQRMMVTSVWQDTANIGAVPRVLTELTVKDWDTWKNNFAEGKQERIDNGVLDRVYGHAVDDNHKVHLVTALMDTAKAFAYWKSDALKKRREAGGVVGEPRRFVFTIVKRY